jgi:nicotinamide-nucleotide adenylyltransferase
MRQRKAERINRAFYIGRFQPYHIGHHTILGNIAGGVDEIIVGIGEDIQRNAVWVSHVLSMTPHFETVHTNNPLVFRLFEEAGVPVKRSPMHQRDIYSGTIIRKKMLSGEDWEHLVPDAVAETIDNIGGVERIREIARDDIG